MIEVNLIPDVKQELLKAQRQRTAVISISILVSMIAIGAVVLLSLYVFAFQGVRTVIADKSIKDNFETLKKQEDLNSALTVQNQLSNVNSTYTQTNMYSRLFDVLRTIVSGNTSNIDVTTVSVDASASTITIEGKTKGGYIALETFKKTILATKIAYSTKDSDGGEKCEDKKLDSKYCVALTQQISDGDRSLAQDDAGKPVLNFSISFTYPSEAFSRSSLNTSVIGPTKPKNATDSTLSAPSSLFGDKQGGQQ